jgi:hypothetical protein
MKNSLNGSTLKPSGIIDGEATKTQKFQKVFDQFKSIAIARHKIFKEKELLIMSSISLIWFVTFFYFVLFVFT